MRLFLREYFFSPSSALPLGLTRVALYTGILVFYGVFIGDFSQFAAGASSLTWRPVGLFPDGILWPFDGPVGPGMLMEIWSSSGRRQCEKSPEITAGFVGTPITAGWSLKGDLPPMSIVGLCEI